MFPVSFVRRLERVRRSPCVYVSLYSLEFFKLVHCVEAEYKVLIVDKRTLKILDCACSMKEILENDIYRKKIE